MKKHKFALFMLFFFVFLCFLGFFVVRVNNREQTVDLNSPCSLKEETKEAVFTTYELLKENASPTIAYTSDTSKSVWLNGYKTYISSLQDINPQEVSKLLDPQNKAWSPTKEEFAFIGGDNELCILNISNKSSTQLTVDSSNVAKSDVAWSPDGNKIAYTAYYTDTVDTEIGFPNGEILLANVATGELTQITNTPDISESTPIWSPDSSLLAYDSHSDPIVINSEDVITEIIYKLTIFVFDIENNRSIQIIEDALDPIWSPDSKSIAYSNRDSTFCFLQVIDGEIICPIKRRTAYHAWNNTGDKLLFSDYENGEIYLINNDGSKQTLIAAGYTPVWSPDGNYIAYTRDEDIYVMKFDGTEKINITNSPVRNSFPTWVYTPTK